MGVEAAALRQRIKRQERGAIPRGGPINYTRDALGRIWIAVDAESGDGGDLGFRVPTEPSRREREGKGGRVSIWLRNPNYEQYQEHRDSIDLSALANRALAEELAVLGEEDEDALAMRAHRRFTGDRSSYLSGKDAGRLWAADTADRLDLRRVATLQDDTPEVVAGLLNGDREGFVLEVVENYGTPDVVLHDAWRDEDHPVRLPRLPKHVLASIDRDAEGLQFLRGFIDGVQRIAARLEALERQRISRDVGPAGRRAVREDAAKGAEHMP